MRLFESRGIRFTCYAVGLAIEKHPDAAIAMHEAGHELATHGWRWIDYQHVDEATEREHMRLAIAAHEKIVGERPLGWYGGRVSPITRRLVVEDGGFLYDADAYNDDLPYWVTIDGRHQLIVPYTLDQNDMKFAVPPGFTSGEGFLGYLKDAFDVLYEEGETAPQDDEHRPALPARRQAGTHGGAGAVHGLRPRTRPRLGVPAHRHRAALARPPPARRELRQRWPDPSKASASSTSPR